MKVFEASTGSPDIEPEVSNTNTSSRATVWSSEGAAGGASIRLNVPASSSLPGSASRPAEVAAPPSR